MRFHLGAVPTSPDFAPDLSWKPMREPSTWLAQFIAFPIGVVTAALVAVLWFAITPLRNPQLPSSLLAFLLLYVGIGFVHELIHAAAHPMAGRSEHSSIGFWPSRTVPYAHYDGELSRNRFIAILLMPLLVLSILPLLVAAAIQSSSAWVAQISSFNALLSCVDMLGAGMVLFQIPVHAIVRNQGWRTYWKEHKR
jgi:hypothetical protein